MTVCAPDRETLVVDLNGGFNIAEANATISVCGNRCGGSLWGDYEVSEWFSAFLQVQCWLARYSSTGSYELPYTASPNSPPRSPSVAFANEQPLLLISEQAVELLNDVLRSQNQALVSSRHFRPNIVIRMIGSSAVQPHAEDGWTSLNVENRGFQFDVVGRCSRCSMVDVDPSSGMKGKTLRALAEYRRENGQINFGIFLRESDMGRHEKDDNTPYWLEEGDAIWCK